MRFNKIAFLAVFAIASVLFLEVADHADEADQSTKITFDKPIQIPGQVLPAGTYLFKLADANDLNLVRVFNADGTRVYATLETISTQRPQANDATAVTMAEQGAGKPEALVNWFYPGNTIGHEFMYSNHEEQQLAQDRQQTILAKKAAAAGD
jgi:hypothetical protein